MFCDFLLVHSSVGGNNEAATRRSCRSRVAGLLAIVAREGVLCCGSHPRVAISGSSSTCQEEPCVTLKVMYICSHFFHHQFGFVFSMYRPCRPPCPGDRAVQVRVFCLVRCLGCVRACRFPCLCLSSSRRTRCVRFRAFTPPPPPPPLVFTSSAIAGI